MIKQLQGSSSEVSSVDAILSAKVTDVRLLYVSSIFALLHTFLPFLSEAVQLVLLDHYRAQSRPGCHPRWLETLRVVMDSFFVEQVVVEASGRESRYSLSSRYVCTWVLIWCSSSWSCACVSVCTCK